MYSRGGLCRISGKTRKSWFRGFAKNPTKSSPAVHAQPLSRKCCLLPRARNAQQNATRASGWTTRRHVSRFVARFSRAGDGGVCKVWAPYVQRGVDFVRLLAKRENRDFQISAFSEKMSRHRACGAALFKSPFRARTPEQTFWWVQTAQMRHLSRLDPPECFPRRAGAKRPSGQRRAARAVAGHFLRKCRKPEITVFAFCQKSDKVHPPLYIPAPAHESAVCFRAREKRP